MGQTITVTGMVISTMPISDYDKRIVILTKERGKITAFARGARRPNSSLLAATNPFAFGEFEVFEGKNSYNVSKASIHNYFRELTTDPAAAYMAFYFLEFADYYCQENNDEKEMLKLLYQSLRALSCPNLKNELVRVIFELKALTINGEGPSVFSCIHCGTRENLNFFSVRRGGMFCPKCKHGQGTVLISDSTRYTMQFIVSSGVETLYTFVVSEAVLRELQDIMKEYLSHYVKHKFKSLEILEAGDMFF